MLSTAAPPAPIVAPATSPTSAPLHASCPAAPTTYVEVFGTGIDDRALLRFVRVLTAADAKTRTAAVAAARVTLDVATTQAVTAAAAALPCSDAVVGNAQDRMASVISLLWGLSNDSDAQRMSDRIGIVASAIAARHVLDAKLVDALVSPFGTTLAALDAPVADAPAGGATCAVPDADAKTIRLTMPNYPAIARSARLTGTVRVKVSIDSEGDVVRASVFNDDLGGRIGADALREASILSAATTVYAPATKSCSAIAGSYVFVAQFTARR
jgi:outer membrane biosynthesis protein TonB